jgi:tripartite-type tricarboxylate transporter receptor subunit TctC
MTRALPLVAAASAIAASVLAAGLVATAAMAQTYPSRPVKVIVPIGAGSGIDIVARAVSQRLQESLGQPFVIENRAGGGTTTGTAAVAAAAPDGYTILFQAATLTVGPATMSKLSYDVSRDLAGIMPITNAPFLLVSPPGKFKSLGDLVKAGRGGGVINYASVGFGSSAHFTSEQFAQSAGMKMNMVTFRGTAEAQTEVVAGRIDLYFTPLTAAIGLIQEKKLDALATTGRKRLPQLPDVPTTTELGYLNSDFDFWVGMLVPAATPREIVDKLHAETMKIADSAEFRDQMGKIGGMPMERMTPKEFDAFLKKEVERYTAIARAAGIKQQ